MKDPLQSTKLSDVRQQPNLEFIASCVCGHKYCTREWVTQPPPGGIIDRSVCTILGISIPEREQQNDGYEKKSHKKDWTAGGADLWGEIKGMMFNCLHNVQQSYVNHLKYLKSVNTKDGNK